MVADHIPVAVDRPQQQDLEPEKPEPESAQEKQPQDGQAVQPQSQQGGNELQKQPLGSGQDQSHLAQSESRESQAFSRPSQQQRVLNEDSLEQQEYELLTMPSPARTRKFTQPLQIDDPAPLHANGRTETRLTDRRLSMQLQNAGFFKRRWLKFWHQVIKPAFPEAIQDAKIIMGMSALKARIRKDIMDPSIFPEVEKIAEVRRGIQLCPEEQTFLAKRKERVRLSFAAYMGVDPEEVHPDDVPIVAYGGSGGGFRAMIGCLAYGGAMEKAGLWDCLTYVAGVSGSCWSIAAYYTLGKGSMQAVIEHCKKRFSPYHPLSGDAIRTILSAPGGARVTLGPLIQKSRSGLNTVAMDLYSVFTTGWIFFQDDPATHPGGKARKEVAGYQRTWHKYSSIREFTDDGREPMPIMTAIRHERPYKHWEGKDRPFKEPEHVDGFSPDAQDAWYQWYEITPYEVGCDEISAWVPTWGFGRPFSEGKSTMQLPEQSLALLLGLATSAPAAPLASYLSTISRNLPTGIVGDSIHKVARGFTKFWGKEGTEEFQNHHPLHACHEHNFMFHYTPLESGKERPPGLENAPRIQLIDSGMDNNCPTYVLLHPHREADVIINMDASSDVQKDSFQERVDQIGSRRGLRFTKRHDTKPGTDPKDPDRFKGMYAQIYDGVPCERPPMVVDSYGHTVTNPPAPIFPKECSMIYMPLLPNEKVVPNFDPSTAKFSGSYNLVWTPDQVDTLVKVCESNYTDGEAAIKQVMYEAWQKKKTLRESRAKAAVDP